MLNILLILLGIALIIIGMLVQYPFVTSFLAAMGAAMAASAVIFLLKSLRR